MKLLLDSAESELEQGQLDGIQRKLIKIKLDEARTHALELNGRDAIYFLLNAPPLYDKLKELKTANA